MSPSQGPEIEHVEDVNLFFTYTVSSERPTEQIPMGVQYVTKNVRNEADIDSSDSQPPGVERVEDISGYFAHASLVGAGRRPRLRGMRVHVTWRPDEVFRRSL